MSEVASVIIRDHLSQVIGDLAQIMNIAWGTQTREEIVLERLIHGWVKRMPNVTQIERRKLLALALCSLLGANSPPTVLEYFPRIISNIVETLNDVIAYDDKDYLVE